MALLPTNFYIKEGQVNKPVTVLNTYFEDFQTIQMNYSFSVKEKTN